MFNCRMASYNRLTLGPAPSDRHKLYTSERDSQRIFRLVNPRSSEFLFCAPFSGAFCVVSLTPYPVEPLSDLGVAVVDTMLIGRSR